MTAVPIGPVWSAFVERAYESVHTWHIDLDEMIDSSCEALAMLASEAGAIAFGQGNWAEAMAMDIATDVPAEFVAEFRARPTIAWWFDPLGDELLVIEDPTPSWMSDPYVQWWSEPHQYQRTCLTVPEPDAGAPVKVTRQCGADEHSGPPAAVAAVPETYPRARRFVIRGASDWMDLVDQYPSRRPVLQTYAFQMSDHVWLPDWEKVADDFDVVTLAVDGFAFTAYLPLTTPQGRYTMLVGWNPGESVLLKVAL
jgi:hypothetical protein